MQKINLLKKQLYKKKQEEGRARCNKSGIIEKIFSIMTDKQYVNIIYQKGVNQLCSSILKYAINIDSARELIVTQVF